MMGFLFTLHLVIYVGYDGLRTQKLWEHPKGSIWNLAYWD